jgi:hypothetical protein
MSLSYTRGQPIAEIIYKDKRKKKEIKLLDEIPEKPDIVCNNLDELLPKSFYSGLRNISSTNLILLKKAIKAQNPNILPLRNNIIVEAYRLASELLEELCKKNYYIPKSEGHLEVLPLNESSRISVFGPSGVGKSTWTGTFLKQYSSRYKKNDIFVFSPIKGDSAFDKVKVNYVKIDDNILDDPLDISEFENSCCVFDDIESINDKKLQEAVIFFRDICLETGRHKNITTLCISHIILNGSQSKKMLNESDQVVVFPRSNMNAIKNLVVRYYGFSKDDVNYLKHIGEKSRWTCIKRSFPTCIISENNIRVI